MRRVRAVPPIDPRREARPPGYHLAARLDVLPLVPPSARSFLEVGAARGGFGATLRRYRDVETLVGIEPENMDEGRENYDALLKASFPVDLPELDRTFDCVIFNDVLEHMADPWKALESARALLDNGGCIVLSVPNIFNLVTLFDFIARGDWPYRSSGVLDVDHLRFFTRRSAERMLLACNLKPIEYRTLDPLPLPRAPILTSALRWRALGFSRVGFRAVDSLR